MKRFDPWVLAAKRPRFSKRTLIVFFIVFFTIFVVGSSLSMQHAVADVPTGVVSADGLPCVDDRSCKQTPVSEPGDLIPMPDLTGAGTKTLFESHPFGAWFLDTELTAPQDLLPMAMNGLANLLMALWLTLVYAAIGISWWLFGSIDVPGLSDATNTIIAGSASTTMKWLFPLSFVVAGITAYLQNKRAAGSGLGQLAWMAMAGVFATMLMTAPGLFTGAVNEVRSVGSNLILSVADTGVSGDNSQPFVWDEVNYSNNNAQDAMLRKSGDTLWRALVATPWCLANFGSIEGCQKYGPAMLDMGMDLTARTDYIKNTIYPTEANDPGCKDACKAGYETPLGQWVKGNSWGQRLGIVVLGVIIAIVMCAFMLVLGFAALGGVILSYLLLIAGVFFAALWCIPGKPRQWGVQWFEALIGSVMTTLIAFVTFSAVMSLLTAVYSASMNVTIPGADSPGLGWLGTMGIAIVTVAMAFAFRKQLANMVGASDTSAGRSMLIGAYVARRAFQGGAGAIASGVTKTARATRATGATVRNGVRYTAGGAKAVTEARRRAIPGQKMSMYYARAAKQGGQYARNGGRISDVRQSAAASRARGEGRERAASIRQGERERNMPQLRRGAGTAQPTSRASASQRAHVAQVMSTTPAQRDQMASRGAPGMSERDRMHFQYRNAPPARSQRAVPSPDNARRSPKRSER